MNKNSFAMSSPKGWNSYDYYDTSVTEAEVKANAQYLADHLKDEKPVYKTLMEELRTMLDWNNVDNPNWREKTDMMPVRDSRFKDRVVLDNPPDFVDHKFVKKDFRK